MQRTIAELTHIAESWIADWNSHDIERIMSHYAQDVEFVATTVIKRWNRPDGQLKGKTEVREHFSKGLELAPQLRFALESVLFSPKGYAVLYSRDNGNRVIDCVTLDEDGLALKVTVFYMASQS